MATFRLVSSAGGLAYLEVEGTADAQNRRTITSVAWQNLTDKPFVIAVRRAGGTILTRTVAPQTVRATQAVSGTAANRLVEGVSAVWNP